MDRLVQAGDPSRAPLWSLNLVVEKPTELVDGSTSSGGGGSLQPSLPGFISASHPQRRYGRHSLLPPWPRTGSFAWSRSETYSWPSLVDQGIRRAGSVCRPRDRCSRSKARPGGQNLQLRKEDSRQCVFPACKGLPSCGRENQSGHLRIEHSRQSARRSDVGIRLHPPLLKRRIGIGQA